jgi:multisubunit Na+/H+ antiporter MnhE subunit
MRPDIPRLLRLALVWAATWAVLAAVWLLLTDTRRFPELMAGVVAAAIAATGSELVRAQRIAEVRPRLGQLAHVHRAVARVPADLALLTVEALRQLSRPRRVRGAFLALRFEAGGDSAEDTARRALAEAAGSLAPNTIVIGVDRDRDVLLVHQLVRRPDPDRLDPLRLR